MNCSICRKPVVAAYRPFCSRRCADIDLGRWLREDYVIPTPLTDPDDPAPEDGENDEFR